MRNMDIEGEIKRRLEEHFERAEEFDTEKGGIYVETTDDFRGWIFRDKTRKIYKTSNLDAKVLTGLFILVSSINDNGSEIKVSVYNPGDIGRMLLSKNNEEGSCIKYAVIEPPKVTELVAKIGEHVCIESLMRGNWIRMRIFPGENILDIIKNDDREILNFLVSPEVDMNKILARLVSIYRGAEEEINILLSKMERYGESCNCEEPMVFKQVDESGKFDDITQVCLNCGGTVER